MAVLSFVNLNFDKVFCSQKNEFIKEIKRYRMVIQTMGGDVVKLRKMIAKLEVGCHHRKC